jgi:AbrB family looped-hinge helix DNA binding protein
MQAVKSFVTSIKARGQVTIPKQVRGMSHLEEGQTVSVIPIGDSILITPRRLELDEARRQMRRILKESGLSMEEILAGIDEERATLYKKTYDKKCR